MILILQGRLIKLNETFYLLSDLYGHNLLFNFLQNINIFSIKMALIEI